MRTQIESMRTQIESMKQQIAYILLNNYIFNFRW